MTSVNVSDRVKIIEPYSFSGCSSLQSVSGFAAVDSIKGYAFQNCSSLRSIAIPATAKEIGKWAFYGAGLKNLTIRDGSTPLSLVPSFDYSTISYGSPFYGCPIDTLYLGRDIDFLTKSGYSSSYAPFCQSLKEVVTGDSVTSLNHHLFYGCKSLESVTFGKSIEEIGRYAFCGCETLQSASLGDKVKTIGTYAFYGCSSMKYLKIAVPEPIAIQDANTFRTTDQTAVLCVPRGSKAAYEAAETWKNFNTIVECPNQDVNQDGDVDVLDVVDIARYVVGNPAPTFLEYLADLNEDNAVNVADAVVLVNEIAGNTNWRALRKGAPLHETDARSELFLAKNADGSLSLHLEGDTRFTAFQFCLHLPETVSLEDMRLNAERKSGHQMLFHQTGDGEYRVVVLSLSNQTFNYDAGELLNIVPTDEPDGLAVSDIHFITPQGEDYLFDDLSTDSIREGYSGSDADAITEITGTTDSKSDEDAPVYNLGGQRLNVPQRGINIIGGKKVIIK